MTPQLIGWAILAAVITGIGYAIACAIWPFTVCSHCDGSGRRESPSGNAYGRCRWCKGSPEKVRFGRRLLTWAKGR